MRLKGHMWGLKPSKVLLGCLDAAELYVVHQANDMKIGRDMYIYTLKIRASKIGTCIMN